MEAIDINCSSIEKRIQSPAAEDFDGTAQTAWSKKVKESDVALPSQCHGNFLHNINLLLNYCPLTTLIVSLQMSFIWFVCPGCC